VKVRPTNFINIPQRGSLDVSGAVKTACASSLFRLADTLRESILMNKYGIPERLKGVFDRKNVQKYVISFCVNLPKNSLT